MRASFLTLLLKTLNYLEESGVYQSKYQVCSYGTEYIYIPEQFSGKSIDVLNIYYNSVQGYT